MPCFCGAADFARSAPAAVAAGPPAITAAAVNAAVAAVGAAAQKSVRYWYRLIESGYADATVFKSLLILKTIARRL